MHARCADGGGFEIIERIAKVVFLMNISAYAVAHVGLADTRVYKVASQHVHCDVAPYRCRKKLQYLMQESTSTLISRNVADRWPS